MGGGHLLVLEHEPPLDGVHPGVGGFRGAGLPHHRGGGGEGGRGRRQAAEGEAPPKRGPRAGGGARDAEAEGRGGGREQREGAPPPPSEEGAEIGGRAAVGGRRRAGWIWARKFVTVTFSVSEGFNLAWPPRPYSLRSVPRKFRDHF